MKKILLTVILLFIVLSTVAVYAINAASTKTLIFFNIGVLEWVQVQMLGSATWVNTSTGGAGTSNNIEFNSTGSEKLWLNATIVGNSALKQNDTNSIFLIQNAGSTNATINITLNSTLTGAGACLMRMKYYNSTSSSLGTYTTIPDIANSTWNGNVTLLNPLVPAQNLYLWLFANFSGCASTDTTTRNFTIVADFAA
jgi:hypothetical protein